MESTTLLSLSCAVCFVIYYELAGVSFIEHLSNSTALVSRTHLTSFNLDIHTY